MFSSGEVPTNGGTCVSKKNIAILYFPGCTITLSTYRPWTLSETCQSMGRVIFCNDCCSCCASLIDMRLSQLKYTVLPTAPPIPTILDMTNNRKSLTMHNSPYGVPRSHENSYQCRPGADLPIRSVVCQSQ